MIIKILRLEGFTVCIAAVTTYFSWGFPWPMFLILLFAPDLSMAGYFKNNKLGALTYNSGHSYALPLALLLVGLLAGKQFLFALALIWIAHIGMDRAFGFGLKHETDFRDTHLGRIGKQIRFDI